MKSEAGFAKVAGVELTLLDCARYFHKSAGISGLAQIRQRHRSAGQRPQTRQAATVYENASVRRLGYLLDRLDTSHKPVRSNPSSSSKTSLPLDPSVKPLITSLAKKPTRCQVETLHQ